MFTARRDTRRVAEWRLKYSPALAFAPVGLSTLVVVPVEMIPYPEFDKMVAKSPCRVLRFVLWHRRSHGVRGLSLGISRSFEKNGRRGRIRYSPSVQAHQFRGGRPAMIPVGRGKILLRTKSSCIDAVAVVACWETAPREPTVVSFRRSASEQKWAISNGVLNTAIDRTARHGGHFFRR